MAEKTWTDTEGRERTATGKLAGGVDSLTDSSKRTYRKGGEGGGLGGLADAAKNEKARRKKLEDERAKAQAEAEALAAAERK
jgi:hypothetical protein